MASMDHITERRMLGRHSLPRKDDRSSLHTALSMFMLMVTVMLMLGATYYYASYSQESARFNALFASTSTPVGLP